jgi:Leucine-rich repeat (LRR) protein
MYSRKRSCILSRYNLSAYNFVDFFRSIKDFDMFCPLTALEELYLGDNQLQGVEFDFKCIKKLRHLDLEYNKIRDVICQN